MAELPTEKELAKLPVRLIVAYAARSAQRMLPHAHELPDSEHRKSGEAEIEIAIAFSTRSIDAAKAAYYADPAKAAKAAAAAKAANAKAANAANAAKAAVAYAKAAYAKAATSYDAKSAAEIAQVASYAVHAAAYTAAYAGYAASSDFKILKTLAKTSDNLSIDLPLWPNGEPKWYTKLSEKAEEKDRKKMEEAVGEANEKGEHRYIELDLIFPAGTSDEEIKRLCTEAFKKLDEGYRAMGGDGLTIDDLKRYDEARVLA